MKYWNNINERFIRLNLRAKLMFLFGLLIGGTLLLYAVVDGISTEKVILERMIYNRLPLFLESSKSEFQSLLGKGVESAAALADDPGILRYVALEKQDAQKDSSLKRNFLKRLDYLASLGYPSVFIASKKQGLYYRRGEKNLLEVLDKTDEDDAWFFSTMKAKQKIVVIHGYSTEMKKSLLFVDVLMGNINNPVGIAGVSMNATKILAKLKEKKISPNSRLWLIDPKGKIIFSAVEEEIKTSLGNVLPKKVFAEVLKNSGKQVLPEISMNKKQYALVAMDVGNLGYKIVNLSPVSELKKLMRLNKGLAGVSVTVLALVITVIALFFLVNNFTAPIHALTNSILQFSRGNLHVELNKKLLSRGDEIGGLALAFTEAQKIEHRIVQVIEQAQNVSNSVKAGSEQLQEASAKLSSSSASQADSTEQISNTIKEMTALVMKNNEHVNKTKEIFSEATKTAQNGEEILQGVVAIIRQMFNKIQVVQEISAQTNILSLNAAIEAARAEEVGEGFAVVSQEVQNLADVTRKSTNEINTLVEKTVEITQDTGKIFSVLVQNIRDTTSLLEEITHRSHEQNEVALQINDDVGEMGQMAKANAKTTAHIDSLIAEFRKNIEQLDNVISEFKV